MGRRGRAGGRGRGPQRALVPRERLTRRGVLDALTEVARRRGLVLIEDAAQAHLAAWQGRPVGAIGDAGTFSFQASKNLNAGEGGIVLTDNPEIYERAWSLVNCGRVREGGWY